MKRALLFSITLIGVLLLNVVGCFSATTTNTGTASGAPIIVAFSAADTTLTKGESTTLIWNVTGATSVQIDQGVGSGLAAAGTISISPSSDTTYTLTASNSAGTVKQSVTVTVTAATQPPVPSPTTTPGLPPDVAYFDIDPNIIHTPPGPGPNNALMRWDVRYAASVTIDGVPVSSSGSKLLSPPVGTHTYTLKATNAYGSVVKTRVLKVIP